MLKPTVVMGLDVDYLPHDAVHVMQRGGDIDQLVGIFASIAPYCFRRTATHLI
jgi:hypothetical protein